MGDYDKNDQSDDRTDIEIDINFDFDDDDFGPIPLKPLVPERDPQFTREGWIEGARIHNRHQAEVQRDVYLTELCIQKDAKLYRQRRHTPAFAFVGCTFSEDEKSEAVEIVQFHEEIEDDDNREDQARRRAL